MSSPRKPIIACGLDLQIPQDELTQRLTKIVTPAQLSTYTLLSSYKAGVMFSSECKLGRWTGLSHSQKEMETWYNKHKETPQSVYFTRIYVTDKILLLDGTFEGKSIQLIISNMTKGAQTLMHRKNALSGEYGKPITIERVEIKGLPYLYRQD